MRLANYAMAVGGDFIRGSALSIVGRQGSVRLAERYRRRRNFIAPLYSPGMRSDFSNNDDWTTLLYLAGDWSYPVKWGVCSDAARPFIAFKSGKIHAPRDLELQVELLPHLHGAVVTRREFSVRFHGEELGNFSFSEQKLEELRIAGPAEILFEEGINTLEFGIKLPFVPYSYNAGEDSTRLGLGLRVFQLGLDADGTANRAPR